VQLHVLQVQAPDLFANLFQQFGRSRARNKQAGIITTRFNLLPCLQQQIDPLVWKDDPLPQHQQLAWFNLKALQGLLGSGCGKVIEKWPMGNHRYFFLWYRELQPKPCPDVVGVADDPIDHSVQVMEGPLVSLARIVGKQIVNRQHDPRAPLATEFQEPKIQWETPLQHGQVLHMNDIGR